MATDSEVLDQLRQWLQDGATLKAIDPSKTVMVQRHDGVWEMNILVTGKGSGVYEEASEDLKLAYNRRATNDPKHCFLFNQG